MAIREPDDYGLRRVKQERRVPVLSAPLHETFTEIKISFKNNETVIIVFRCSSGVAASCSSRFFSLVRFLKKVRTPLFQTCDKQMIKAKSDRRSKIFQFN